MTFFALRSTTHRIAASRPVSEHVATAAVPVKEEKKRSRTTTHEFMMMSEASNLEGLLATSDTASPDPATARPQVDDTSAVVLIDSIDTSVMFAQDASASTAADTRIDDAADASDESHTATATAKAGANKRKKKCKTVALPGPRFSIWNPFSWLQAVSSNGGLLDGEKSAAIEEVEATMFRSIKTPHRRFYVDIGSAGAGTSPHRIWTVAANEQSTATPIVVVHGFCGGIAMWIHNVDAMSESRPFYAFDMLGFGRSSRPNFSSEPVQAEAQFVDAIEHWRQAMRLDAIILMGHSFGGYLTASYVLRYPQHVRGLILADPWGFPEQRADGTEKPRPLWVNAVLKVSQYVNVLSIFRAAGQSSVRLFRRVRPDFERKYSSIMNNPELVYDYIYHANSAHPSGEAGFRAIQSFFGYAKNPMIRRVDRIDNNIPIWFLYGSHSWISSDSGFQAAELRADSIVTSVQVIEGAGHHIYADRPGEFNQHVRDITNKIDQHTEQIRRQQQQQQQQDQ